MTSTPCPACGAAREPRVFHECGATCGACKGPLDAQRDAICLNCASEQEEADLFDEAFDDFFEEDDQNYDACGRCGSKMQDHEGTMDFDRLLCDSCCLYTGIVPAWWSQPKEEPQ
jgi:hypothetical protein